MQMNAAPGQGEIWSVTRVIQQIQLLFAQHIPPLWVEGEISNYSRSSAGHRYFSIKDERNQLKAAFFKGRARGLKFEPEDGSGTNPEEMVAAAHAACFSMALSAGLEKAGHPSKSVNTKATVHLDKGDGGFSITKIELDAEADVPGIEDGAFQEIATATKSGCPISKALSAVEITLDAKLMVTA